MVHPVDTKILSDILVIPHWQAWENRMNSTSGTELYKISSFVPVRSCLLLPSLATIKGVSADSISTGGIGAGKWSGSCILMNEPERNALIIRFLLDCRGFPPAAGLSFSCWLQINRFTSACDSHPIRLLSVVRHMSRTELQYICLSISFSACDGCLVLSTEEEAFTYLGKSDMASANEKLL